MPKKLTKSIRAQLRSFAKAHHWTMAHSYAFLSLDTIYGPNPFNPFGNQIKKAPDVGWTDLPIKCKPGCSACLKHLYGASAMASSITVGGLKVSNLTYVPYDESQKKSAASLLMQINENKKKILDTDYQFGGQINPPPKDLDSYCVVVPKGGQLLIQAKEECVVTMPHSKVTYLQF